MLVIHALLLPLSSMRGLVILERWLLRSGSWIAEVAVWSLVMPLSSMRRPSNRFPGLLILACRGIDALSARLWASDSGASRAHLWSAAASI